MLILYVKKYFAEGKQTHVGYGIEALNPDGYHCDNFELDFIADRLRKTVGKTYKNFTRF